MNIATQRRIIALSALVTFSLGFLKATNDGELPSATFLVGVGVAFTLISVITDLGSSIGAGFAILIMIGSILTQFDDVMELLDKRSGGNLAGKKKRKGGKKKGTNKAAPGKTKVPPTSINIPSPEYPNGVYTTTLS